jgi:serine/threonine protein kinase
VSEETIEPALANTTPAESAQPDGELAPGTIVAERWTIVRFLARGGMGEVYEAHDRLLDGPVALKTLRSGTTHERFLREVQLARKVSHPNVCRIHDAGRHGTLSFLTMELLAGESLSERLRRGRMDVTTARPVLADLAAALDAAHAAGVIHRDFKPHNVMLVKRGDAMRAVVTDFGIARAADDDGSSSLTGADELVGTPAYMAPEQVSGKPVTAASDVYSLGVVAYQMVTGTVPFAGQNPREVATARLVEKPRPPREIVTDLDRRWNDAILAALAIDPSARPKSATAFLASLDAPATPPPRKSRASWIAPIILLAGIAAALVVWQWPTPRREHPGAEAEEHYRNGNALYGKGRFDEAIAEFLQVDEDLRTPEMLFNIAQAYRKKGDPHQAIYFYKRFLADADRTRVPPAMIEQVTKHIRTLEAAIAADAGVPP